MKLLRLLLLFLALFTALYAHYDISVTGSTAGAVWGTDVYTTNSDIGTAAVHAGLIAPGQTATIRVFIVGRQFSFSGSARNGVTSGNHGLDGSGLVLSAVPGSAPNPPSVMVNAPPKVIAGQPFWLTTIGTDSDGDLATLVLNWSGVGVYSSQTVSGDNYTLENSLTAPLTPGSLQVRGEVSDRLGNFRTSAWYTVQVVPAGTNLAPTAWITGPTTLVAGQSGTWTYETVDSNSNLSFWKLSLGSTVLTQANISGGDQTSSYPYTFASGGTYALTVYAEDTNGLSTTSTLNITVLSPPANYIDYGNLGGVSCYPDNSSMHPYARPGLAYSYSYLNDGSDSNDHGYGSVGGPNWLLADFGSAKKVLRLYTGGGHITGWGTGAGTTNGTILQYSSDNTNWTNVYTYTNGFAIGGTSIDVGTSGVGITARYWRIYRSDWMATTEFRFEGDPTPYILTVQNGSGTATGVYAGTPRPILANSPPASNYLFDHWALISGAGSISDPNSASTNFILVASDATVSAFYVPNVAPTASITGSTVLQVGEEGTWSYTADDANKNLSTWCVSLLPNTAAPVSISGPHQSASFTYTFTSAGTYTFHLEVVDTFGLRATSDAVVEVQGPPAIATQPQNQSVVAGGTAVFSVVATGTPAPSYQWKKGGVDIVGATAATLTLAGLVPTDGGSYSVAVSNSRGSVVSNVVTLTVNNPPLITSQPGSQTVTTGGTASFAVTASGFPAPAYQWRKDGTNIIGATAATFVLTNAQFSDAGNYSVVVTNNTGFATSNAATLTVVPNATAATNVTSSSFVANWSAVGGATGYRLDVSTSSTFASYFVQNQTVNGTAYAISGLSAGTTYYYRVRAVTGTGTTPSSDTITASTAASAPPISSSVWIDLNGDGLLDEIIPPGDDRFGYAIAEWHSNDTDLYLYPINDYFSPWTLHFFTDGVERTYLNFGLVWNPPVPVLEIFTTEGTDVRPEFWFNVESPADGSSDTYDYGIYQHGDPAQWVNIVGALLQDLAPGLHNWLPNFLLSDTDFYQEQFYLVRFAKPIAKTRLSIGNTAVNVGATGAGAGTIAVPLPNGGSATVNLGTGAGSVTLPDGTVVDVNGSGVVTVNGSAVPIGSTTVGGIGLQVDSSGGTLTIPNGPTLHVNPDGSGSINLASGAGISVASNGHLSLSLPPGTPQTIVQAVDILGKVLQPGAGAVITVRDLAGLLNLPMPSSGVIGDIDAAITAAGVFQVGVKLNDSTTFWFDVNTLPQPQIAVDANRDGTISLDSSDATSGAAPYRFWLNDDIDRHHVDPGYAPDQDDDDIDPADPTSNEASQNGWIEDWSYNQITSLRDLEDFSRIWLNLSGVTDAVRNGQLYVGLRWANTTGAPWIKLYPHVEPDGGTKYLFDSSGTVPPQQQSTTNAIADVQRSGSPATILGVSQNTFVLPTSVFANLTESSPLTHLLFEGCSAGTGELKLVLLQKNGSDYTEIAQGGSVWFDLKEPKEFIQRWSSGDGDRAVPQQWSRLNANSGTFAPPATDAEKDLVLYVHGYNMTGGANLTGDKQRWIETTYKRLYWLGYKGRVAGFSWPCAIQHNFNIFTDPLADHHGFDDSEMRAWQSGTYLMQLVSSLKIAGYRVHMLAHSQGNVVAGEALRLWKSLGNTTPLVSTYIASQGAIPAHCYDATVPNRTDFIPSAPNVYGCYWTSVDSTTLPALWGTSNPSYLSTNDVQTTPATTFANFYNPDDYALTGNGFTGSDHPGWLLDQRFKPDTTYGYTTNDGFLPGPLRFPDDRYQVYSYAASAWSLALGSTSTGGVFNQNAVDLKTTFAFSREHLWHSAEFRSYNAARWPYWAQLLRTVGIQPITP